MKHFNFQKQTSLLGDLQSLLPLLRDLVGEDLHPPAKVVDLAVAQVVELGQVLADQLPDAALEHLVPQLLLPRRKLEDKCAVGLFISYIHRYLSTHW